MNYISVVQIAGRGGGYAISGLQTFRDFKTAPTLVFSLPGRPNLPFGNAVSI